MSRCITLMKDTPEELAVFMLQNEFETILVAFNPSTHPVPFSLPEGKWQVFVEGDRADDSVLYEISGKAEIAAISAFVAILKR